MNFQSFIFGSTQSELETSLKKSGKSLTYLHLPYKILSKYSFRSPSEHRSSDLEVISWTCLMITFLSSLVNSLFVIVGTSDFFSCALGAPHAKQSLCPMVVNMFDSFTWTSQQFMSFLDLDARHLGDNRVQIHVYIYKSFD